VDTLEEASMGVMERRKRRAFTKEFKGETVKLVVEGGRSIPEVLRVAEHASDRSRSRRCRAAPSPSPTPAWEGHCCWTK